MCTIIIVIVDVLNVLVGFRGCQQMMKTMYLHFKPEASFEPMPHNGHSRMTLVLLEPGEVFETNRALIPATAIVLDGEIAIRAEVEKIHLKPGEAMLLEPNEQHSLKAIKKSTVIVTRLANLPKELRQNVNSKKLEAEYVSQIEEYSL